MSNRMLARFGVALAAGGLSLGLLATPASAGIWDDLFGAGNEEHWAMPPKDDGPVFAKSRPVVPDSWGDYGWRTQSPFRPRAVKPLCSWDDIWDGNC